MGRSSLFVAVSCIAWTVASAAPPTSTPATRPAIAPIRVERRPALVPGKSVLGSLLLRELGRQSVVLAAERAGVPVIDDVLTPHVMEKAAASRTLVVLSRCIDNDPYQNIVEVGDDRLDATELPFAETPEVAGIPYDRLVTFLAPRIDGEYARIMRDRFGGHGGPAMVEVGLPDNVESLLRQPDAISAFHAARLTVTAINRDGESPLRLGALARAYANLGESTRMLLGAEFDVFFARALLDAERLVLARPDEADSYWTRAYVRALVGLEVDARVDMRHANELGGSTPDWATLIEPFIAQDGATLDQIAVASPDLAALAAHLAMRTREFGELDEVIIDSAAAAWSRDPADLRAMAVAHAQGGLAVERDLVERMPVAMNRAFAAVDTWAELPRDLRSPFQAARARQFDATSRLQLWAALDGEPVGECSALPWGTLAEFAREASLLMAQRQMQTLVETLGVDANDELNQWWPVIKDHPFAPVIESWARPVPTERLATLDTQDEHGSARMLVERMRRTFKVNLHPSGDARMSRCDWQSDRTSYDISEYLWWHRGSTDLKWQAIAAKRVQAESPDSTLALCVQMRADWQTMKQRLPELERLARSNVEIAYRLALAFMDDGSPQEARRVLTATIARAPVRELYGSLGKTFVATGDLEGYVRTLKDQIANTNNLGLDHAFANDLIAHALLADGQTDRAQPYAQEAGDSYSAWGLETQAEATARAGDVDGADALRYAVVDRYGASGERNAFRAGLIHGRPAGHGIDEKVRRDAKGWETSDVYDRRIDFALLAIADGDWPAATRFEQRENERLPKLVGGFVVLAACQLQADKPDDARATLAKLDASPIDDAAARQHKLVAKIARTILDGGDPPTPGGKDDPVKPGPYDTIAQIVTANDATLLGVVCERAGHLDAASAWYGLSARMVVTTESRLLAMMRLRALGRNPY